MLVDITAVDSGLPPEGASPESWRRRTLHTTRDVGAAVRPILESLSEAGFSEEETFGVRLALEEALVNAIKHGHGGDPDKRVRLRYRIDEDQFLAEVEDEGRGFDPARVADPLDPANWERDGGRGLFLIRHHMTWLRYNAAGNCVTLCKRRGPV